MVENTQTIAEETSVAEIRAEEQEEIVAPVCAQAEKAEEPTLKAGVKLGEVRWRYALKDKKRLKLGNIKWRYLGKEKKRVKLGDVKWRYLNK